MSKISDFTGAGRSRVGSRVERMSQRETAQIEVTHIYKISNSDLKRLFATEQPTEARKALLEGHGGPRGILHKVQSEANAGIMGDERDLYRRQSFFGVNEKPVVELPSLLDSLKEAANDKILALIAIFAVLSIITGMIYNPWSGWIEGVSIIVSLAILVTVSSLNDWSKDKTFVNLQSLARDESLPTLRGKIGSMQSLNIWDLVVGDVIQLSAGDKVPADCLVVESANLEVDQSKLSCLEDAEEKGIVPKSEADPFLYAESYIQAGSAKAVVTCVGRHSTRGIEAPPLDTSAKTPLENKLFNLSKTFTFLGIIAAAIILAVTLTMLFIGTGFSDHEDKGKQFLKRFIENMTVALVIIIVSIPEGLPMTVAISLSYSVIDMFQKDKILVRDLTAPEKMGEVTEILCGKTGTMTTEEMRIESCFAQNCHIKMFRPDTILNCAYNNDTVDLLKESILWNTEAHIEMTDNAFYVPEGNGTEVSLIKWLQGAEIPVQKAMLERESRIRAWIPFDTKMKKSIIAVEHPQVEGTVRVYIKGAPEVVVNDCVASFDQTGNKIAFDQEGKNYALTEIMRDCMTAVGLRAIAFSYKDYSAEDFAGISNFQSEETIRELESAHTFVGMVSMKDPLRENVQRVVQYAYKGRMNIRMVSGDNLDTAKAMAVDAGILSPTEFNTEAPIETQRLYAMDAQDFREQVGPIERSENEDGKPTYRLANQQAFNQMIETLKVLGRSTPEDKLLVTVGLQNMDSPRKVAVVGDGLNDLEALQAADVSFAMGSGKSISRNAASIVLLNNDFEAVMRSVMWGRNIYSNVRKFLQFQITCNLAVLVTIVVGTIWMTESPLSATQLIWINLIMDTLGAMALATAPPLASIIHQPAVSGDVKILNKTMWRQIYGVALWMVLSMFITIYFGRLIFDLDYEKSTATTDSCSADELAATEPCLKDEYAADKKTHFTVIFTSFVFLNFFNLINCRVIGADEYNIFKKPFNSFVFILVLAVIFAVQWITCGWKITMIFETQTLTGEQFGRCVLGALPVILAALALKLTPAHWVELMPVRIDEEEVMGRDSILMSTYENQAKGGIPTSFGAINADEQEPLADEETKDDDYERA